MSWLDNLDIHVQHGNLLTIDAEAIVVTTTQDLGAYGKLSKTVFTSFPGIVDEINRVRRFLTAQRLTLGQAVTVNTDNRNFILAAIWSSESPYDRNLFYKVYINSIREAFKNKIKVLVMPIMDYGHIDMVVAEISRVLTDLSSLSLSDDFPVEVIYFVSLNASNVGRLKEVIRRELKIET